MAENACSCAQSVQGSRAFYHDQKWQAWEETAATWVKTHAPPGAIVATSAPHFFYLRTGLRARPPLYGCILNTFAAFVG